MFVHFLQDPLAPVLQDTTVKQVIGIAAIAVSLFIANVILCFKISDRLKESNDADTKIITGLQTLSSAIVDINNKLEQVNRTLDSGSDELHEQWSRLNEQATIARANNTLSADIKLNVDEIAKHQAVMAAALTTHSQGLQRVIEGLMAALQEHKRG